MSQLSPTFTKIADNTDQFTDFNANFAINNSGIVAFDGNLVELPPDVFGPGRASIFTGDGDSLTKISDASNLGKQEVPFREFVDLDINDQGTIVFSPFFEVGATLDEGRIVVSSDGKITTPVNKPSRFQLSVNNNGTVAFIGESDFLADLKELSIVSSDESVTNIANTRWPLPDDPVLNPDSDFTDFGDVDINDGDLVVFTATLIEDNSLVEGDSAILTVDEGIMTPLIDNSGFLSSFENVAINNSDTVVFSASLDAGGSGVYTIDSDGSLTTVADSSGVFDSFGEAAINNNGAVAFLASLDAGDEGIFTGSDPITDRVIATGDPLFGSTVTDLDFTNKSLNDFGQIAGFAELANGTEVIFRADPKPDPDNVINGTSKQDFLTGTEDADEINGFEGRDILVGLKESDWLNGGEGRDILIGVDPLSDRPGFEEIDLLTGGKGRDYFVLGDPTDAYYTDENSARSGTSDYGLITDFTHNDVIVLSGEPRDYLLVDDYSVGDRTGTGIFLNYTVDELIGLVQGTTDLSLSSNHFSFI